MWGLRILDSSLFRRRRSEPSDDSPVRRLHWCAMRRRCCGAILAILSGAVAGSCAKDHSNGQEFTVLAEAEAEWELLYRDVTPSEISHEIEGLRQALSARTDPYYESRFAAGAYSVCGEYEGGKAYELPLDEAEIAAYRFLPNGSVGRVVLPPEQFLDEYKLKRQLDWLQRRRSKLEGG